MADLATEFMKTLGPQVSTQLAGTLGIKKQTATQLIPSVLPLIMGGMKRQMETRGGAGGIGALIDQNGDGSVLDDVAGFLLQGGGAGGAGGLLGGLLGRLTGRG